MSNNKEVKARVVGIKHQPFAKAEMLIRRPVADVFEAFVNPAITSKFWFTKASGRLEPGKQIRWDWEMYDFSVQMNVKTIERNARILIEWPADGAPTTVEWVFTPPTRRHNFCECYEHRFFRRRGSASVARMK